MGSRDRSVSLAAVPCILLVRAYQLLLRPFMGGQCRFQPTCSDYALEAYREHGLWRGTVLVARRLMRCHPFGRGGYDPVPPTQCRNGRPGDQA